MEITQEIWKEINAVLFRYAIPFGARFEKTEHGWDKHIQINCVIKDYFNDDKNGDVSNEQPRNESQN